MIFGPIDDRSPNAPVWSGRSGWVVYAVSTELATAATRAAEVAAAYRAPLAPGTWPVDTPADTRRIAVGPVYVAVRTRQGHAHGAPLAAYYVLRRWMADDDVPAPDPAWPVPAASAPANEPASTPTSGPRDTRWPFVAVGHRASRAFAGTLGADVITWRGRLAGRTITFSTQPRTITPQVSFMVSANARIHDVTEHTEFVDVLVHHPLGDAERAELAALAQAQDPRPVVVRCTGERLRATSSMPGRAAAAYHPPTSPFSESGDDA